MGGFTSIELQAQIDAVKAQILQLQTAIAAFGDPTVSRYRLDTGQTVQDVERRHIPAMYGQISSLQNQVQTLHALMSGSGITVVAHA